MPSRPETGSERMNRRYTQNQLARNEEVQNAEMHNDAIRRSRSSLPEYNETGAERRDRIDNRNLLSTQAKDAREEDRAVNRRLDEINARNRELANRTAALKEAREEDRAVNRKQDEAELAERARDRAYGNNDDTPPEPTWNGYTMEEVMNNPELEKAYDAEIHKEIEGRILRTGIQEANANRDAYMADREEMRAAKEADRQLLDAEAKKNYEEARSDYENAKQLGAINRGLNSGLSSENANLYALKQYNDAVGDKSPEEQLAYIQSLSSNEQQQLANDLAVASQGDEVVQDAIGTAVGTADGNQLTDGTSTPTPSGDVEDDGFNISEVLQSVGKTVMRPATNVLARMGINSAAAAGGLTVGGIAVAAAALTALGTGFAGKGPLKAMAVGKRGRLRYADSLNNRARIAYDKGNKAKGDKLKAKANKIGNPYGVNYSELTKRLHYVQFSMMN